MTEQDEQAQTVKELLEQVRAERVALTKQISGKLVEIGLGPKILEILQAEIAIARSSQPVKFWVNLFYRGKTLPFFFNSLDEITTDLKGEIADQIEAIEQKREQERLSSKG